MTTPNASERMNDEVGACQMCDGCGEVLLAQNGGPNSGENVPCPSCVSTELREQIDALRAELTAARTPPTSDELAETLTRVRFSCGIDTSDRVQRAFVRLSAAKAEAERERDEARASEAKAEAEAEGRNYALFVKMRKRADAAETALAAALERAEKARADALEEAVKIVAGFAVPTPIPTEGVLNFIIQRDFRIAEEIRALKTTPTQESETP